MSKQKRGKYIKTLPNWRGTCPICKRKAVKLVWQKKDSEGKTINVCKLCFNKDIKKLMD